MTDVNNMCFGGGREAERHEGEGWLADSMEGEGVREIEGTCMGGIEPNYVVSLGEGDKH